jgi:chromosome partitioning protein
MSFEEASLSRPVCVLVVANEKGGSGKSTVAMHAAIALIKRGARVATIDLDARQKSLTHYVENRRAWAERAGCALETPDHLCLDGNAGAAEADGLLAGAVAELAKSHDFIVIDTPGHDGAPMRQAHALADVLVTPLNDSFVDLDVLGSFDADSLAVTGVSHYAATVEAARGLRRQIGRPATDWVVLRNRLSMTSSRNKRLVGAGLESLGQRLGFRCVEGLAERLIFREFYLRGLTALDDLREATLGTRPTMSHVTARQEVENLLAALNLGRSAERGESEERSRDAA